MIEIGPNLENALIHVAFWVFMAVAAVASARKDEPWFSVKIGDRAASERETP